MLVKWAVSSGLPAAAKSSLRALPCLSVNPIVSLTSLQPPTLRSISSTTPTPAAAAAADTSSSSSSSSSSTAAAGYTISEADDGASGESYGFGYDESGERRQAWFVKKNIEGSNKKLNLVAKQIRGLSVNEAIAQMTFSLKGRSSMVRHVLHRAVNRAEFFHGLTADDLKVAEAFVGKGMSAPRIRYHAKGRAGRSRLRRSRLTVRLEEMTPDERSNLNKFSRTRKVLTHLKDDPRFY